MANGAKRNDNVWAYESNGEGSNDISEHYEVLTNEPIMA